MKTFVILIILAVAGYYGWKYLDEKVDVQAATDKQAQEMDQKVQQGVGQAQSQQAAPPQQQSANPVQRTSERILEIQQAPVDPEHGEKKQ